MQFIEKKQGIKCNMVSLHVEEHEMVEQQNHSWRRQRNVWRATREQRRAQAFRKMTFPFQVVLNLEFVNFVLKSIFYRDHLSWERAI